MSREGKELITQGIERYARELQLIFGASKTERLVQVSILERRYVKLRDVQLDILWATLNSKLRQMCQTVKLYNVMGNIIPIRFVNVSFQYHEAVNRGMCWGYIE